MLNAKLSVVEAERNLNAATFQLLTNLGVFDVEGIRLPVESYDPTQNFEDVKYKGMTALTDRYVPEFVEEAVDKIKTIPGDISEAAVNLVKPDAPETLGDDEVLDLPIISNKERPDLISPKN